MLSPLAKLKGTNFLINLQIASFKGICECFSPDLHFILFPFWLSVCERERQGHTNGLRHTHTTHTEKQTPNKSHMLSPR